MNRLWVRISLMIGGVLFLVFFFQFLSIVLSDRADRANRQPRNERPPLSSPRDQAPRDQVSTPDAVSRLPSFMALSAIVGAIAGILISRTVSGPISDLARASRRLGQGDLNVRVAARGSQETIELATTFNQMAADLQRAEQLRKNLMADVSHELRTPLTVLEGNLRAALDHVYALDEAEIANLFGQTRHLIRLVNDLRELALAESHQLPLEKQLTDLDALLAETVQAIEPMASENGVRLIHFTTPLPHISVDSIRIRQVLMNLLSNAIRHTPPAGEITVSGTSNAEGVWLSVQDSGDGLAPDQLNAVFDRFYRADKSRSRETGGTGLGLAIVKAIVEAHDGRVEAKSAGKQRGSTFSVYLPR